MSEVELRRYVRILWKWLWLIVLCTAIAAGVSYRVSKSLPRIYRSSMTLMVGDNASPTLTSDELTASQRLANSYAQMIPSELILAPTVEALQLPTDWQDLEGRVLVTHTDNSQFLDVRVVDSDPARVKAVLDEIARQVILQSPTTENATQLKARQQFVQQQLDSLQANISQGEADLAQQQAALAKEVSARGVLDRQDQIQALQLKLTDWRATYASLLSADQGKPPNTVTVIDPPSVPTTPFSPNVRANVLAAAALGFLLALGAAFLIEYFNDTLTTKEDVNRSLGLPTLGTLGDLGKAHDPASVLVTARCPSSPDAEAYRMLRTNILFALNGDGSLPLLITSPGLHEGKSLTSANLAVSFAQTGKTVILADADLRHPTIRTYFNGTASAGESSPVPDHAGGTHPTGDDRAGHPIDSTGQLNGQVRDSLLATDVAGLRLLATGPLPPNPAELLGSTRMEHVLRAMQATADVVILDSPPMLPVADTAILAATGVAVVLVIEAGKTRARAARLACETLMHARARVLGVVLNKAPGNALTYHRYLGHYRDGQASDRGASPVIVAARRAFSQFKVIGAVGARQGRRVGAALLMLGLTGGRALGLVLQEAARSAQKRYRAHAGSKGKA
ncbi:MAG TPA: Wzz/FepE/Etk N-terminal domain-containing protein [Chloroflexota bacterium]|nr:Wzz/FepE/Etk N-terminal domain-containing protein [Chloroflexota bacterium]